MKKILFITNGFPSEDNPCKCVYNLRAAEQVSQYYDVKVMALRAWKPFCKLTEYYQYGNLTVRCLFLPHVPYNSERIPFSDRRWMYRLSNLSSLMFASWIMPEDIKDYWLIHSVSAGLPAAIASKWSRRYKVPHVVQLIGSDVNTMLPIIQKTRGFQGWERGISGVIANSNYLKEEFKKIYPEIEPITVIYRGTQLNVFNPLGKSYDLNLPYSGVRFLFLGGFPGSRSDPTSNKKGGYTLVKAWQMIEELMIANDASLIIGGPNSNSSRLQSWRSKLRDPERVLLLSLVEPNIVPKLMRSVDVVIIPSLNEGFPNVGMEAFASGKPVLGSNVGAVAELVRNGIDGALFPPGDIKALGELLHWAVCNKQKLREMGKHARKQAERIFDSTKYAENVVEFYTKGIMERYINNEEKR